MTGELTVSTSTGAAPGTGKGINISDGTKSSRIWNRLSGRMTQMPDVSVSANFVDTYNVSSDLYYEFQAAGNAYFKGFDTPIIFNTTGTTKDITFNASGDLVTYSTFYPYTNLSKSLGKSTNYFSNTYSQRYYLNSTAYLNGSTAGQVKMTGTLNIGASIDAQLIMGDGKDVNDRVDFKYLKSIPNTYWSFSYRKSSEGNELWIFNYHGGSFTNSFKLTPAGELMLSASLGRSSEYVPTVYTQKLYLNSTAYTDGATAGQFNIVATNIAVNGTNGATGTFTTADSKTVTVTKGIITSIV